MRNPIIGAKEASDLRKHVEKVLRGLGNPEPPLDLRYVRELLKLDVQYFSTTNTSFLQDTVSRIKIAGKQILKRPSLLIEAVRKADLSALWLPDHRRILIDSDKPKLKHRWSEAHETGHSLAPWHKRYLFGDNSETLRSNCHETLEAEANYAAGQLLFLQDRFTIEANDLPASFASVQVLHKKFGNTMTSTLWRFVEESHQDKILFGIVSQHPHKPKEDFDPNFPCKYFVESAEFKLRFAGTCEIELFNIIKGYSSRARGGPLGSEEAIISDINGDRHIFRLETFFNGHEALTLAVYSTPAKILVSLP